MTREQMLVLIDVLDEAAGVLEVLPVQPSDALTDAVLGCAVKLRKAQTALMLTAAGTLLAATAPAEPSAYRGRGD